MIFGAHVRRNAIRFTGERSAALDRAHGRLVVVYVAFCILFVVAGVRAFDLTILRAQFGFETSETLSQTYADIPSQNNKVADHVLRRGNIVDRNGVLLATSLETSSLYADPKFIDGPQEAARGLVDIFPDLSYGDVLQKLQSDKRFIWIKRNITPDEQYQVLELGQPGLEFEREDRRIYPQENLAPHLLGYTDIDNHGLAGIERSFDNLLREGKELRLTLDVRLQHILRRDIQQAMSEFNARGGAGVILDAKTGAILAGVSLPDFTGHLNAAAHGAQKFNRLTLGVYELGSVFKAFSTAAFLNHFNLPMSTTFDAREPLRVGRHRISDFHPENRELTIPEVFMHSSNIGTALMAQQIGTQKLQDFYDDLGLLSSLDFEIKEIGKPLLPDPWREANTLTASYGHGLATTPLQTAAAMAAVVNGGFKVKPHLIQDEKQGGEQTGLRVMESEVSDKMRGLLRLAVTQGTGKKADVAGYIVGGKTGTAEKIGSSGYDSKRLISSFLGAFPMDDPDYVVLVMVDEPKGNKKSWGFATAGWVAAPAFANIVSSMAAVLGIAPRDVASSQDVDAPYHDYVLSEKKQKEGAKSLVSF